MLAVGIELGEAHLVDLGLVLDAELLLRFEFGRQTMAVPPEPPFDLLAAHGLKPRDEVLDVSGQQVTVVREAVGERRTVVEDKLLGISAVVDTRLERLVVRPRSKHFLLQLGERHAAGLGARDVDTWVSVSDGKSRSLLELGAGLGLCVLLGHDARFRAVRSACESAMSFGTGTMTDVWDVSTAVPPRLRQVHRSMNLPPLAQAVTGRPVRFY